MVFCKPFLNYYGRKKLYNISTQKICRLCSVENILHLYGSANKHAFFRRYRSWKHPILFILTSCLNLFCLMVVELLYTRMGKLLSTRGIVIIIRAHHIFSCCYKPYKPGKVQWISLDLTKAQGRVNFSPLLLSKLG